jgi:4-hydroxy-tetrahydrodipicolinate synthase
MVAAGHPLTGVLPVIATPFAQDWSIDAGALAHELDWLYQQRADGLTVAMASEITRLATDERERLATLVCDLNRGRGPVVLSVGAESTPLAVGLARHAERAGASALMANPPLAARPSVEALVGYYRAILDAVAIPVIVQDASGYVGTPLPLDVAVRLHDRYGDRVMFKPEAVPTGPLLAALHEATGHRAAVFEGSGGLALVDSYRRGIAGTIPGPDLVWAIAALWHALREDDDERVYAVVGTLTPLLNLIHGLDGYVVVQKYLLVKQGVLGSARARGPLGVELDPGTVAELDRLFDRLVAVVSQASRLPDEV